MYHQDLRRKTKEQIIEKLKSIPQSCPYTIRSRPAHTKTMIRLQIRICKSKIQIQQIAHKLRHNLGGLSSLLVGKKSYLWKNRKENNGNSTSNNSRKRYWQYRMARNNVGNNQQ